MKYLKARVELINPGMPAKSAWIIHSLYKGMTGLRGK